MQPLEYNENTVMIFRVGKVVGSAVGGMEALALIVRVIEGK